LEVGDPRRDALLQRGERRGVAIDGRRPQAAPQRSAPVASRAGGDVEHRGPGRQQAEPAPDPRRRRQGLRGVRLHGQGGHIPRFRSIDPLHYGSHRRATIETAAALLRSRLVPRDLVLCGAARGAAILLPLVAHLAPGLLDWRIALALSALLAVAGLGWVCVVVRRELIAGQRSADLLHDLLDRQGAAEQLAALGSWVHDLRRNTLHWSEGAFRLFGVEPSAGVPP